MDDVDLLEGLPGLRDYYPESWKEIEYVLTQMRDVSKSYGYEEYEGPSIEPVELIEAKSGAGLIREIFQLTDRSDRRLLLRPEQTPTLAKMLAREQQRYKRPLRWFSIPRLFRDETVQKGRVREFWQLNVDILGEDGVAADAEVIAVGVDIIRGCGIGDDEFNFFVNHRSLLNEFFKEITDIDPTTIIPVIDKKMSLYQELLFGKLKDKGLDPQIATEQALLLRRIENSTGEFKKSLMTELSDEANELIEKSDELIVEALSTELSELGISNEAVDKILQLVMINGSPFEFIEKIEALDLPSGTTHAVEQLKQLAEYLDAYNVIEPVVFDASMARGLDYYTGIVFEAFDSTGEIVRAILGGGRYSDLVEVMGGTELTGVGFGMGETVIMELMRLKGILAGIETAKPEIYVAPIKTEPVPHVIKLATRLRSKFEVLSNPFDWKIGRHFEFADSKGAKITLLLGMRDIGNNVVSVRIMHNSEQLTLPMDENLEEELEKLLEDIGKQ